jgi:DNA (cytosine-5)-methyltransferase 1
MRYGSVCSGIEAATQAWHGLRWEPAFFSDIEKFPVAVLQHHYPDVPCHGDFTDITEDEYGAIDLLVGGTPCQSFSVAGLRGGMDDDRGNLALEFIRLAQRKRPQWLVWENVPGVLSSNGGRDFGSFLGALAEIGYGFAYRVLDAQYFGVAQRRRRVFVVGYLGDWRRAAAVLFERESLSGNPAPSREKGEKIAPAVTTGPPFSRTGNERVECEAIVPMRTFSGNQESPVAGTLETTCHDYSRSDSFNMAVYAPETANCLSASPSSNRSPNVASGQGDVVAFSAYNQSAESEDVSQTVAARNDQDTASCVAFAENQQADVYEMDVTNSLSGGGGKPGQGYQAVREGLSVRRLTPTECERLQGFPDGFTQIPWRGKEPENCPDGPRYKALGNSMAVPCMRWIGERIQAVEAI